jgi:hypothetical protein
MTRSVVYCLITGILYFSMSCTREHRVAPVLKTIDSLTGIIEGQASGMDFCDSTRLMNEVRASYRVLKQLDTLGSDTFSAFKKWQIEKYNTSAQNILIFFNNRKTLLDHKKTLTERLNFIRMDIVSGVIEDNKGRQVMLQELKYAAAFKKTVFNETQKLSQEWDTCQKYRHQIEHQLMSGK